MRIRRKRYSDTAMEAFRWLVRAVGHGSLDLKKIEMSIKKRYKEQPK